MRRRRLRVPRPGRRTTPTRRDRAGRPSRPRRRHADADADARVQARPSSSRRSAARCASARAADAVASSRSTRRRGDPVRVDGRRARGRSSSTRCPTAGAAPQKATFYDGIFKVTQNGDYHRLALSEALACLRSGKASAAAAKPKTRKLWGDGKGKFRTRGSTAPPPSAAPSGSSRTRARHADAGHAGLVTVRDQVRKKTSSCARASATPPGRGAEPRLPSGPERALAARVDRCDAPPHRRPRACRRGAAVPRHRGVRGRRQGDDHRRTKWSEQ